MSAASTRWFRSSAAALALALAASLPAQAAHFHAYTAVDGGSALGGPDLMLDNETGAPLTSITGNAQARTTLLDQHVSASDTTHWTLGPYATTNSNVSFGVAGGGEAATVSFTFVVTGGVDLSLASDHNTNGEFGLQLYGQGADIVWGSFGDVNCIGCGGHIGGSNLNSHGVSTPWDVTSVNATYTLTTTVDTGRANAGRIEVSAALGVGGTQGHFDIRLSSLLLNGQAATLVDNGAAGWSVSAVPEPGSWGLALAGVLVVGWSRRKKA